jgi:hypothetical protein
MNGATSENGFRTSGRSNPCLLWEMRTLIFVPPTHPHFVRVSAPRARSVFRSVVPRNKR